MARYAGGGKNTVEGCRSIDVLRWHKLDYLRSPQLFSWAWTTGGERMGLDRRPNRTTFCDAEILA
jgi:hypothetical protein